MRKGPGRFARFEEHDVLFPLVDSPTGCDHAFSALCKSVVGTVSFDENGAFQYIPKQKAMRGVFGSGSKELSILQNEIVGIVPSGVCGFEIWYCPLVSNKPGEAKRKLVKSPTITVVPDDSMTSSPEEVVDKLVDRVRRTCCWGGRSMQQTVAIVLTPEASSANRPILQKTFLPILQDAAALKVRVFDGVGVQDITAALDFKALDILIVFSEGMMEESKQEFMQLASAQNPSIQVCFIPSASGVNSSKSDWCPATTAHAVCKGSVCSLERSNSYHDPSPRQSKLRSAATNILNSIKDGNKAEQQWKGEPGFVCEVLRDIVSSGKNLKDKCGTLQAQMSMKTRWSASQPDMLLAVDEENDDNQLKPRPTKSWRATQLRSPFTGWGQHDQATVANNKGWIGAAGDEDHDDTLPAFRPFLSATRQLSA